MTYVLPSRAAIDLIKKFESLHDGDPSRPDLYPKLCPANVVTYGWGRAAVDPDTGRLLKGQSGLRKAMKIWGPITRETADEWFAEDIARFSKGVARLVKVQLNTNQMGALVSLAYNIGLAGFRRSTVLRRVNKAQFADAARAFHMWNKARNAAGELVVMRGLVRRRAAEAELFMTPAYFVEPIINTPKPRPALPYMPETDLDRSEEPVEGDDRSLTASRTVIGSTIAGGASAAIPVVEEVTHAITPLAAYSEYIYIALTVLGVAGALLAIYARVSDRNKGHG